MMARIMTIEFLIPQSLRIKDLKKDLLDQFKLSADPVMNVQRTFYDSFDWRLYKKGLSLYSEDNQHQTKLILASINMTKQERIIEVDSVPQFARDFESPVFTSLLQPILGARALLPRFNLHSNSHLLKLTDKDEKTCLLIQIENPRLEMPDKSFRFLGKRIRLQAVKGYHKPVEKISDYLRKQFALKPQKIGALSQSIELLDIESVVNKQKPAYKLKPAMPIRDALTIIMLSLFKSMMMNENGVLDDIDSEFLHDFRVAVRKTRTVLIEVKDVFPDEEVKSFAKDLDWLGEITGPVRDADVFLLKFSAYSKVLPVEARPLLEPLRAFMQERKSQENKRMFASLRSKRYQKFRHDWHAFLLMVDPNDTARLSSLPAKQVIDKHCWDLYRSVIKKGKRIKHSSADEKLHKLRISCKKLNYLLTFFMTFYSKNKLKPVAKSLKKLQNYLGEFHDYSVQITFLTALQEDMAISTHLSSDTQHAMDLLKDSLKASQQSLRKAFDRHYKSFASKENEMLFASAFNPNYADKIKRQS
jgi:CHAD domain-containing protein